MQSVAVKFLQQGRREADLARATETRAAVFGAPALLLEGSALCRDD
jgi:hypothetical protein